MNVWNRIAVCFCLAAMMEPEWGKIHSWTKLRKRWPICPDRVLHKFPR